MIKTKQNQKKTVRLQIFSYRFWTGSLCTSGVGKDVSEAPVWWVWGCIVRYWRHPAGGAVPASVKQGHTVYHSAVCCSSNAAAAVVFPAPHCRTAMADSASESDTDGAGSSSATPMSSSASNSGKPSIVISQFRLEELTNRLASLQQENKVLKIELETFKLKCKALQEENRDLRKASVTIVSNVS